MEDTQEKIVNFFNSNAKYIFSIIGLVILISGAYGLYTGLRSSSEYKAQEEFGKFERQYNEKRQDFLQAKTAAQNPPDKSKLNPTDPQPKIPAAASGDITQDFGSLIEGFQNILKNHSGTQAAKMSALYLSEIFVDYKKIDEALEALTSQTQSDKKDLLSILLSHRKAALIADKGLCPEARSQWQKLMGISPDFLKNEIQLRLASCFEQEGQVDQARQIYQELSQKTSDPEGTSSKDAEKFLRYLNFKNSNTPVGKAMDQ